MSTIDETNVTEERSVKAILTSVKMYENLIAVQRHAEDILEISNKHCLGRPPLWKIKDDIASINKASKILLIIEELTKDQNRTPTEIYQGLANLL